jgi:hypothetical protein
LKIAAAFGIFVVAVLLLFVVAWSPWESHTEDDNVTENPGGEEQLVPLDEVDPAITPTGAPTPSLPIAPVQPGEEPAP